MSGLISIINNIKNRVSAPQKIEKDEKLYEMLEEAHEEWENAEKYFQNITEPDLIDYATFKIETAKRKYAYILKQMREQEIKSHI